MRLLCKHVVRLLLVVLIGGFLGTTLVRMAPGFGVDEEELDTRLSEQSIAALRAHSALHESLPVFYWHECVRILHGDLGFSTALQAPVRQLLAERFPETLKSIAVGLAIAWTLGFGFALASVMAQTRAIDVSATLIASLFLCIPAAVLALLSVLVQAPGRVAIGLIVFPKIFHYSRNLLARASSLPHVLTARCKGLGEVHVLLRHVLPVAAPQILALGGVSICLAFAAAIPVEVLCDIPGLGQLAWKAALSRDLELLVLLTMIVTTVTLLANTAAELATVSWRRTQA